ncbi:MAG: DUF1440 domain-containing protein [Gemmatimonadaceae bacterium]
MLVLVLSGVAAGVAATWIMTLVTTFMYEREDRAAREREDRARGDMTAYEIAADRSARLVGRKLTAEQRGRIGNAIHWGLGIAAALVYAFFREQIGDPSIVHGLIFGLLFWAVMDEGMVPLLRLTPGPFAFPWQTHFRGLVGHLVFGAVTEAALGLTAMLFRS